MADADFTPVVACPGCLARDMSQVLFGMKMFGQDCRVVRCRACSLVYKDLVPTPAALDAHYADAYVHFHKGELDVREANAARERLRISRRLLGEHEAPVRLLDVGCGRGAFVAAARSAGYEAYGVDPHLPPELESDHLRRAPLAELPADTYDVAVLLNVAEHLAEPRATFAAVRRSLRAGGVMLLTCPYGDSLHRRVYRERWTQIAIDEHLLFWTPTALTKVLRELDFAGRTSVRVLGAPFPYGRVAGASVSAESATERPAQPSAPSAAASLQGLVWRVARQIQRHAGLTNAVRSAIARSGVGDYLEYAIAAR